MTWPPPQPNSLAAVDSEVFEGAGFHGLSYLKILEAFDEWDLPVFRHAGTSAGAITAMLRALRYKADKIRDIVLATPWDEWTKYRPPAFWRLAKHRGWTSIKPARKWIRQQIKDAGLGETVSFAELQSDTHHELRIVATRYARTAYGVVAQPFIFSPALTPGAIVADAVLASMAIQVFWPMVPVEIDGVIYWFGDGGVVKNCPSTVFSDPRRVVSVRVDTEDEIIERLEAGHRKNPNRGKPCKPPLRTFAPSIFSLLRRKANYVPKRYWERMIRIVLPADDSSLDFTLTDERMEMFEARARAALVEFCGRSR